MIRYILLFFTFILCTSAKAQLQNDSMYVSTEKIIQLAQKVKTQDVLIKELKSLVLMCDTIIETHSGIIAKKDAEIEIYRKALTDYGVQDKKQRWYKTPAANYFLGILTGGALVYIGSQILIK